jgi:hypothetical protein
MAATWSERTGLDREVDGVLGHLRALGARLVNVGHGPAPLARHRAHALTDRFVAVGGEVGALVSWPATAASWLRPATRLCAGAPDAWVVADDATSWPRMSARLLSGGQWSPDRTVAFPGLDDPALIELAGVDAVRGLRGVDEHGGAWRFGSATLIREHSGPAPA